MRWLAILLVPLAAGQPTLHAVVPEIPGGGSAVAIQSNQDWNLDGYWLADGETTSPLAGLIKANQTYWAVSSNSWHQFSHAPAHWPLSLELGLRGDEVRLGDSGGVIDAMGYGTSPESDVPISGTAHVLQRDSAGSWTTPRTHRLGESNLDRPSFTAVTTTAYSSPDNSHQVLVDLLSSAKQRVQLHVYELTSPSLIDALAEAASRVPVQVLLEDRPVGLDAHEKQLRDAGMRQLIASGAHVFEAGSVRYKYHHLKVLVVDDAVAVQSENWVANGVPENPSWGNRGWGVVVQSAALANWFTHWMEADRNAWDSQPANPPPGKPPLRFASPIGAYNAVDPVVVSNTINVTPIVSPEHTSDPRLDPVIQLINNASKSIDVQQLDLSLQSRNPLGWAAPDSLTTALAAAAKRGVEVRVQAAAPFRIDDTGNREALEWLRSQGVKAREFERDGITSLHNKGMIIDANIVVVGSMNGNHHSRSNNREVGLIIHDATIASYYADLFQDDWDGRTNRDWSIPVSELVALPATQWPTLLALVWVGMLLRCYPRFLIWQSQSL